jgi:4-hydroxy-tetrahydrodipicolinate synthase
MTNRLPRGLSVAVATPMLEDGSIDFPGLKRHASWLVEEGVDVLMPCGTTGESATLDGEEQRRVLAACIEAVAGKVPVYAGAGSNSTAKAVQFAKAAREEGADGLLIVTPYYNRPSQEGLFRYYSEVAEAGQGLPVILYNVPSRTGVNLKAETTLRLAEVESIVGIKEASGDLDQIMTLLRDRPEGFLVLSGDDAVALAMMALGGEGVVSVAANEIPRWMKELVDAALSGDLRLAREIHYRLLPLMRANFVESNPVPVKTALHLMGKFGPHVRSPLAALTPAAHETLRKALTDAGLIGDER